MLSIITKQKRGASRWQLAFGSWQLAKPPAAVWAISTAYHRSPTIRTNHQARNPTC